MNATVSEWIAKAEGDYATAARELRATDSLNFDAVCFHAEQCVEKFMKASLIQLGVVPPRNHDLPSLDRLLSPVCSGWSWPLIFVTLANQRTRKRRSSHLTFPREFGQSCG